MNWKLLKNYSFPLILIGIVILFIFFHFMDTSFGNENSMADLEDIVFAEEQEDMDSVNLVEDTILVDVKGEVIKPGVYSVHSKDRVNDVIQRAGGLTEEADENQVNLAQKVFDEMIIFVPKKGEASPLTGGGLSPSEKIRINYASEEELMQLKGIGPSKASAIIQYREEHGHFQRIEDLLNVSGIGEKTLENFKDDIQVP